MAKSVDIHFPPAFKDIFSPTASDKIYFGGRGSGKSWAIAGALILEAFDHYEMILCAREFQTSIADSVHPLLVQRIIDFGLRDYFKITDRQITCTRTGSKFRFAGLHNNPSSVRSFEGVTKCWTEEAQRISTVSLRHLIPTIFRQSNIPSLLNGTDGKRLTTDCQLYISMNPESELDPIYCNYIKPNIRPDNAPADWKPARPEWIVERVNFDQNPYFPRGLDQERKFMLETDFESYQHVWLGDTLKIGAAIVFGTRIKQDGSKEPLVHVETFDSPEAHDAMFYFGADFGFANDPSCLIRCFLRNGDLFIDQEWYGFHVELDSLPYWWGTVPLADKWPIYCDCSQPATISYMSNQGFNALPAEKWPGSVEDGIRALKGFRRIVVHERCVHTAQEFRLYRYKTDKNETVLPVLEPGNDHVIDSCRYALWEWIKEGGEGVGLWGKFAAFHGIE